MNYNIIAKTEIKRCNSAMNNLLFAVIILYLCGFLQLDSTSAALTVTQGRRTQMLNEPEWQTVVGLATVELSGNSSTWPTYLFDCVTDQNNGSGLTWTRLYSPLSFTVDAIPDNLPGVRMYVNRTDYPDLGMYVCSDRFSDDIVGLNFTDQNPAIVPAESGITTFEDDSVELSFYVSGYPQPNESQITWRYLDYSQQDHEIPSKSDERRIFKDSRKTLLLLNVQPDQSGLYSCFINASIYVLTGSPKIENVSFLSPAITEETNSVYNIPLAYKGRAISCSVSIDFTQALVLPTAVQCKWYKSGLPLPQNDSGIISEYIKHYDFFGYFRPAVVLTWKKEFSLEDTGHYQCVVRDHASGRILAHQDVLIKAASNMTQPGDEELTECHVEQRLVYFKVRLLGMDCLSWNKSQKQQNAAEFKRKVVSAVQAECQCNINSEELRVIGIPECSTQVEKAAVLHGIIETKTRKKTEKIFCALYSWQLTSPVLLINGVFQAVVANCTMAATLSARDECYQPTMTEAPEHDHDVKHAVTVMIIGGTCGFIMVVILLITIVCCIGCYCYHREKRKMVRDNNPNLLEVQSISTIQSPTTEEHTYDCIDFLTAYGTHDSTQLDSSSVGLNNSTSMTCTDTVTKHLQSGAQQLKYRGRPLPSPSGVPNSLWQNGLGVGEIGGQGPKLPDLPQAVATTPNNANLYEHISIIDLQLDGDEVQPYSEPIESF